MEFLVYLSSLSGGVFIATSVGTFALGFILGKVLNKK